MGKSSRHFYGYDANGVLVDMYGLGIKEARAKKAMVSPTTALKEALAEPYNLKVWAREQLVKACTASPQWANESDKDYFSRVDSLSYSLNKKATDFGIEIHDATEKPRGSEVAPHLQEYINYYWMWHEENVERDLGIEERVADTRIGVAGKLDRRVLMKDGTLAILDTKTQGIKGKHYISDSWAPQLAAYRQGTIEKYGLVEAPRCINLVINSNTPSPVIPIEWNGADMEEAYKVMTVSAWLWSLYNNHWPCGRWELDIK